MYLRTLHIKNSKLIQNLHLSFTLAGQHRPWTLLIGRNGRCKTTLLQAIALAAASHHYTGELAGNNAIGFRPLSTSGAPSSEQTAYISAIFEVPQHHQNLRAEVQLGPRQLAFSAASAWVDTLAEPEPLGQARNTSPPQPGWFVAAYGVSRSIRFNAGLTEPPVRPHFERLRSLFDASAPIIGFGFIDLLEEEPRRKLNRILQDIIHNTADLLPDLRSIELRGRGGVTRSTDLLDKERIVQHVAGRGELKIPASWLSQGYQSSLAWMADLIGYALWEDSTIESSQDLRGLVLIDELDLHLHPSWQVIFIQALKATFPNLQFITTTHSPLLLSALRPEEIVALELDDSGYVVQQELTADPRLMTSGELMQEFFEVQGVFPRELGAMMQDYRFIAMNPYRDEARDREAYTLYAALLKEGLDPGFEPVPRLPRPPRVGETR